MNFKHIDAEKARIATAGITGRIYLGVPDTEGKTFVGVTKDVTSDCVKAIIDKCACEASSVLVVTENGVATHEIEVRKIGAKQ